jgi:anti-sigma factor RsiW
MFRFKYHYCKVRMAAFINGELPPDMRRRMGRYIDECADCYAEYRRQRALLNDLSARLPTLGQPDNQQLERVWLAVQAELLPPSRQPVHPAYFARYGLATLMLMVVLLVPFVLSGRQMVSPAVATQPRPAVALSIATASAPHDNSPDAVVTLPVSTADPEIETIAPEAAPEYIPQSED